MSEEQKTPEENELNSLEESSQIETDQLTEEEKNNQVEPESEESLVDNIVTEEEKKLNSKLLIKVFSLIICALIYFIITLVSNATGLHDIKTKFISSFISVIMNVTYLLASLSLIVLLAFLLSKNIAKLCQKLSFKKKKAIFTFFDWFIILPACAVIVSFCFAFLFTFATVDGVSMMPTIKDESTVFVSYNSKIDRFDVVVCYVNSDDNFISINASDNETYFIKRVIGMPGDRVTYNVSGLYINDEVVDEYYFSEETKQSIINNFKTDSLSDNRFIMNGQMRYKEDGEEHIVTVIPDGYYLVMGDNRNNSRDSRAIGLIPERNIEGVVLFEIDGAKIKKH